MSIEKTAADTAAVKAVELLKREAETIKQVATHTIESLKETGEHTVETLKETGEHAVETLKQSTRVKRAKKGIPAVAPDLAKLDGQARYHLAGDPKTPVETLRSLAEDKSSDVLVALAGNPKTPPDILEKITRGSADEDLFYAIAGNPSAPPQLLQDLTDFADLHDLSMVSRVIADNPSNPLAAVLKQAETKSTGSAALRELAGHPSGAVRMAAAGNPELGERAIRALFKAQGQDQFVLRGLAGNLKTPPDILLLLADSKDYAVLAQVAVHKLAPAAALEKLASAAEQGNYWLLSTKVAEHPHTPPQVLEQLALRQDPNVARALLKNPNTTAKALQAIVDQHQGFWGMEEEFGKHPNTSPDLLAQLAGGTNNRGAIAAAGNPRTPIASLEKLAESTDFAINDALAKNPGLPPQVAVRVAHCTYPNVIEHLLKNKATPAEALDIIADARIGVWSKEEMLAQHPNASPELLTRLAIGTDQGGMLAALANPRTPAATLEAKAASDDFSVLNALARNPKLPETAAIQVAKCTYPNVIAELLANKATPGEALRIIADARVGVWNKEDLLLKHRNTPPDVRARLKPH